MLTALIGKTVSRVLINAERTTVCFDTDAERFCYQTEADCCNDVWINHLSGLPGLLGEEVLSIEERNWEDREVRIGYDDHEEAMIVSIMTHKGKCDLEFRNNHNGYYGGSVEPCEAPLEDYLAQVEWNF